MNQILRVSTDRPPKGPTVVIVGSGAGGTAAAIDMAVDGWDVLMTDPYPDYIPESSELHYVGTAGSGTVKMTASGIGLADSIGQADLIVIATLATAAPDVVDLVVPSLHDSHTILAACGGLTSLAIEAKLGGDALVGELSCFPYSARFRADGSLNIRRRRPVRAAATAAERTPELGTTMPAPWVGTPAVSVLHAAILNPNYVVHPASVVINLASRDRDESVPHEGLTDGARRIATEIDRDKCELLRALSLPEVSLAELMEEMERGGSKARMIGPDPAEPILDRYLSEDCGIGLSLLSTLADVVGVELPTINAIRSVLAASLDGQLPMFPFDLIGTTPSNLVNGGISDQ